MGNEEVGTRSIDYIFTKEKRAMRLKPQGGMRSRLANSGWERSEDI